MTVIMLDCAMHIYLQSVNHTVPMNKHITLWIQGSQPKYGQVYWCSYHPIRLANISNDVTNCFMGYLVFMLMCKKVMLSCVVRDMNEGESQGRIHDIPDFT